jgi:cardiolipin synthase
MRDRRPHLTRRHAGVAGAVAIGVLAIGQERSAHGQVCPPRTLPSFAVQPPGASFECQPAVCSQQKAQLVREALCASASALAHAPLCSATQVTGRELERLAVRAREIAPRPHRPPLDRDHRQRTPGDLGGAFGGPPTPARITLLSSSEAALQALLGLIGSAAQQIDLMMYGWEDDPTGREVAAALAARATSGIRVRLLVDRTGFLLHNPPAAQGCGTFLDELRRVPNVAVIEPPGAFFRFDHRKLAVVDGRVAWTGGMILTEVARRRWRNLAFLAEGPIVAHYACLFEERWRDQGGCPATLEPVASSGPPGVANACVRMTRTDVRMRSLRDAVYHAVDHAEHHIYLENPYFSDEILIDKLVRARARGVDVRAILTLRGNVERLNRYETLTANRLLKGGVRVYLFPAMTHVKALSADGVWAYIGTGNFDELSLRNNREVGLSVASAEVACALDQSVFLPDMGVSEELCELLPRPRNRLLLELFAIWY